MAPDWGQLFAAALSGPALWGLIGFTKRRLLKDPKAAAEARKLNIESDGYIADRLMAEIERLDHEMKAVRAELDSVRAAAIDEKRALENENKALRTQVGRLRRRVEGLEKILKVEVKITPAMQRLIDELPDDSEEGGQ